MKHTAIYCESCKTIVFSRARHDFHSCKCGKVFIDGGFDYSRVGFTEGSPFSQFLFQLPKKMTLKSMFMDWNNRTDKHGSYHLDTAPSFIKVPLQDHLDKCLAENTDVSL